MDISKGWARRVGEICLASDGTKKGFLILDIIEIEQGIIGTSKTVKVIPFTSEGTALSQIKHVSYDIEWRNYYRPDVLPEWVPVFRSIWNYLKEECTYFHDEHGTSFFNMYLDIDVVKASPDTLNIEDDDSKNTASVYWLECGRNIPDPDDPTKRCSTHDYKLDCGGLTFEEAVITLFMKLCKIHNVPNDVHGKNLRYVW